MPELDTLCFHFWTAMPFSRLVWAELETLYLRCRLSIELDILTLHEADVCGLV